MPTAPAHTQQETEIRQFMAEQAAAIRNKDLDGILAHHSDDFRSFDLHTQMETRGLEAYRKVWQGALPMMNDIETDFKDLDITASDTVAFASVLNNLSFQLMGKRVSTWMRSTFCFEKRNGQWLMTHAHASAPADMMSGKAMLNLKP